MMVYEDVEAIAIGQSMPISLGFHQIPMEYLKKARVTLRSASECT